MTGWKEGRERGEEGNSEENGFLSPSSLSPPRCVLCPLLGHSACPSLMWGPGGWEARTLGARVRTPGREGALVLGGLAGTQDRKINRSVNAPWEGAWEFPTEGGLEKLPSLSRGSPSSQEV